MNQTEILTQRNGAVLTVSLNRPDRLNALTEIMCRGLAEWLGLAHADQTIRVVVLRGTGRAFSAGGDVKQMAEEIAGGRQAAYFEGPLEAMHAAALAIRRTEKPVIAALRGAVAGAGLNLALGCDYRVAADDVVLIQAFTNIGLVPDTGGTYLLPRLVGWARATELLFEGRPVGAQEAERLGLVHWVVPREQLEATTNDLAKRLAARPTRALGLTKRLLNESATNTLEQQLSAEQRLQRTLGLESSDFVEGVTAFVEKREPRFSGQ